MAQGVRQRAPLHTGARHISNRGECLQQKGMSTKSAANTDRIALIACSTGTKRFGLTWRPRAGLRGAGTTTSAPWCTSSNAETQNQGCQTSNSPSALHNSNHTSLTSDACPVSGRGWLRTMYDTSCCTDADGIAARTGTAHRKTSSKPRTKTQQTRSVEMSRRGLESEQRRAAHPMALKANTADGRSMKKPHTKLACRCTR